MKFIIIFFIACSIQLIASQDTTRECINNVIVELEIENADEWIRELNETVTSLQDARRRCDEMTNERLRDACILAWQAQVALELARLRTSLQEIAGDEKANEFLRLASACFGVQPEEVPVFEKPE
ncbi:hypothetical protein PVAND_010539 [Polypedilum vanderplanki]|uniref:Uncharacterized protein n=1 Tax=Polypedilum vanderplanki TaxID=319348 RepID=A0A9J6CFV9_POLVA|nr:hypothetical protein PVAND_010539 [Polypedilum vanderplanki]